jgi:hypothetical protein
MVGDEEWNSLSSVSLYSATPSGVYMPLKDYFTLFLSFPTNLYIQHYYAVSPQKVLFCHPFFLFYAE